jgi:predicted DNA binding CopG/RHH family protein
MVGIKLTTSQLTSVQEYCKLNNIEDVDKFISKCYVDGFNIKKYGLLGDDSRKIGGIEEKQVEIEVIREKRVEVPVEVVKYVEVPVEIIKEVEVIQYVDREVIKEVPVEIIKEKIVNVIQEVPVPNIDKIGDEPEPNDKAKLLQETLQKLRKELTEKNSRITELEEINKRLESIKVSEGAVYLKGSNINKTL